MGTADCTTAAFLGTFLRLWVCLTWQIQPPCPPQAAAANGRPPQKRLDFWPFLARFPPRWDSVRFSSVAQSCLTLCDPMDCSMPGFPVHHQLLELAQTHVHPTISSSVVPFSSCLQSFPASGSFPVGQFFASGGFSFSFSPSSEYSGLISFRIDWLDRLAVQGTLKSLLQHHSSKASVLQLSFLYSPTLTSIHDY